MDLSEALSSCNVSSTTSEYKQHPIAHARLYKTRGDFDQLADKHLRQELKRKHILANQKQRRNIALELARTASSPVLYSEADCPEANEHQYADQMVLDDEDMTEACDDGPAPANESSINIVTKVKKKARGKKRHIKYNKEAFRNRLMLSEWFVTVPDDFYNSRWLMVPVPVGKRCLVIASNGRTLAFMKSGFVMKNFPSALPGGSSATTGNKKPVTILDCIFSETSQTFHILDVLMFNGTPYDGYDTDFRLTYSRLRIVETVKVDEISRSNAYRMKIIPAYLITSSDWTSLSQDVLIKHPLPGFEVRSNGPSSTSTVDEELDGILFYHKDVHYIPGADNPLVLWLKGFMMPELFPSCHVSNVILAAKPSNYANMSAYMAEFDEWYQARLKLKDGDASTNNARETATGVMQ